MTQTTAPAFTHSLACEERAIGITVLALIESGETVLNLDELAAIVDSNPRPAACYCGELALTRVENALRLARKRERAHRNSPAFGSAEYSDAANRVDDLVAERAAIREALAR